MSYQLTLEDAIAAGERGMHQAEDAAGYGWTDEALTFLTRYAQSAGTFTAEEVVDTARICGLIPPDQRAWGGVFQMAARRGVIRRTNETYQRRKGHGSVSLKWSAV